MVRRTLGTAAAEGRRLHAVVRRPSKRPRCPLDAKTKASLTPDRDGFAQVYSVVPDGRIGELSRPGMPLPRPGSKAVDPTARERPRRVCVNSISNP